MELTLDSGMAKAVGPEGGEEASGFFAATKVQPADLSRLP
jgi:hypothetical protein